jgi:hypothetical protein
MKILRLLAALLALVSIAPPAPAQVVAPNIKVGNTTQPARGTIVVDSAGNDASDTTNHAIKVNVVTGSIGSAYVAPVAYTSGTPVDLRAYGTITLTCTVAPSAGTIQISPDNNSDYIAVTAVLNNSSGVATTASITSTGVYSVTGHMWVSATLTGGTCFIAAGQ